MRHSLSFTIYGKTWIIMCICFCFWFFFSVKYFEHTLNTDDDDGRSHKLLHMNYHVFNCKRVCARLCMPSKVTTKTNENIFEIKNGQNSQPAMPFTHRLIVFDTAELIFSKYTVEWPLTVRYTCRALSAELTYENYGLVLNIPTIFCVFILIIRSSCSSPSSLACCKMSRSRSATVNWISVSARPS